ncbi:hypothetical protein Pmani_023999 [Petrolisthes manimaculis]|uniref:Uncharacterized protein n=1 Tax=Petrolisthes manimaculis TaxID=1843537 RepID=A0AAE1TZR6_9EUCA|nr:hypothetical protein Pmani_023999 [Petrolisthes manimaculis]
MSGNTSDEFNSTPPLAFKTLLPDVTQEMLNSSSSTDKEDAKEIINSDNQLWANEETNTNMGIYHNTCCDPLGVNEFESSCDSLVSGKVNEVKEKNMFYLALDDDLSDFDSSLDTNKAGSSSYYSANLEDKVDGFM